MAKKPSNDDKCLDDLLQCMICFEPFTNPKMLQCGHTYCQDCLQRHHTSSQQERRCPSGSLCCPTCRETTPIPRNGIAGLRNDFKVTKMEGILRKAKIWNRRSTHMCNPCTSRNKTVDAKVYCVICNANYCEGCMRVHSANPVFRDHTVVDKSTQLNSDSTELRCKIHKDEESHYFCEACKTIVCTFCIFNDHGDHDVILIKVACEQQQQMVRNLEQIISGKVRHKRDVNATLKAKEASMLTSCSQAESDINKRASQMIESINKQKTHLLGRLRQMRDQNLVPIRKNLKTNERYLEEAQNVQDLLRSNDTATQAQLLGHNDDLIKDMRALAEDDELMPCDDLSTSVKFLEGNQDPIIGRIEESLEVIRREPNASTKEKPQAKVAVDAASTAERRRIVKEAAQRVEGENWMDRSRRKLEVMRLIVQYQDPHLWSDVNDVILEDGRLNLAGVFTREDIPKFVYVMKSGVAAEDITSIDLGSDYDYWVDSRLDLSSVTDMEDICSCLSSLPRLEELWLNGCHITDSGFAVLAKTLTTQCPEMTFLGCFDNEVTSDVAADVEILLEKRKQLTINLGFCRLSPETCRRLKEAFGDRVSVEFQKTK